MKWPGKDSASPSEAVKRKKYMALAAVTILVAAGLGAFLYMEELNAGPADLHISDVLGKTSTREQGEGMVVVSDEEPMYGLIAAPAACWYDIGGSGEDMYGLVPLLFSTEGEFEDPATRFVQNAGPGSAMTIGDTGYGKAAFSSVGTSVRPQLVTECDSTVQPSRTAPSPNSRSAAAVASAPSLLSKSIHPGLPAK